MDAGDSSRPDGQSLSPSPTVLDRLVAGFVDREDIAREIAAAVYEGLEPFCRIPDGYAHCELAYESIDIEGLSDTAISRLLAEPTGEIINPSQAHLRAIELFRMLIEADPLVCEDSDPLCPAVGAYLYGPPGVGKTHIMAAYGLRVRRLLDCRLTRAQQLIGECVGSFYRRFLETQAVWSGPSEGERQFVLEEGSSEERLNPYDAFKADIEQLKETLRGFPYRPTDLLYLGFGELCELYRSERRREGAIRAVEDARVVFVDDVHRDSHGEALGVIRDLIERRYELGRPGTFITTNLAARDLGGDDPRIAQRILSRCSETFVHLSFEGCEDWRIKVKARRVRLIEQAIEERLASRTMPT